MVGKFFPDRLRIESQESLDDMINHNFSDDDIPKVILAVHYFYFMRHHPERDIRAMVLELVEAILEKNQHIQDIWNQEHPFEDPNLLREQIRQEDTALHMLEVFPIAYLLNYGV